MKKFHAMVGLFSAAIVVAAVFFPAAATMANIPIIKVKQGTSTNWSGYAAYGASGTVTKVAGSWTVPEVTAGTSTGNAYSSIWVGIDGYNSGTVEQIGTEQDWINGKASYSVWYEMYPKFPVTIKTVSVHPKDVFTASVEYGARGSFTLTITNTSTGESYSTTQKCPSAKRSSAEWVVEAPWSGGVLPLANFGTASFTGCSATMSGTTSGLSNSSWNYDVIDMVNSSGGLKADTTATKDGTSFSVKYVASN